MPSFVFALWIIDSAKRINMMEFYTHSDIFGHDCHQTQNLGFENILNLKICSMRLAFTASSLAKTMSSDGHKLRMADTKVSMI